MTRNRLFLSKRYSKQLPKEYSFLKTLNILFIHDITKIILYEGDKFKKLYAKFLGLFHFLFNTTGRYDI
jgi:rhamnosyltransferase